MCAAASVGRKSALLNVCKMHVLQCMGKNHTIAEDSTCKWPERNTTGCTNCHMWETCDGRDIQGYKRSMILTDYLQFVVTSFVLTPIFQIKPTSVAVRTLQIAWPQDIMCVSVLGRMQLQRLRPWASVRQDCSDVKEKRCQLSVSCLVLPEDAGGGFDLVTLYPHLPLHIVPL